MWQLSKKKEIVNNIQDNFKKQNFYLRQYLHFFAILTKSALFLLHE